MKMKRVMVSGALSVSLGLMAMSALASDSYFQNQYDTAISNIPGMKFGYAQENAFRIAVPLQQEVHVNNDSVGFNYDLQNTTLVGVSGGVGIAVGIQGKTVAIDVNTGQAIMVH